MHVLSNVEIDISKTDFKLNWFRKKYDIIDVLHTDFKLNWLKKYNIIDVLHTIL